MKEGQNIRAANVYNAITDVKVQLKDGVHPNEVGYKAIEEYWVKVIDEYLNGK